MNLSVTASESDRGQFCLANLQRWHTNIADRLQVLVAPVITGSLEDYSIHTPKVKLNPGFSESPHSLSHIKAVARDSSKKRSGSGGAEASQRVKTSNTICRDLFKPVEVEKNTRDIPELSPLLLTGFTECVPNSLN